MSTFELYRGFKIHPARIAPRDRFFVLPAGSACPEHDAPHYPSRNAARDAIDREPHCMAPVTDDADSHLCGAYAPCQRIVEDVVVCLCAAHASELDAERNN